MEVGIIKNIKTEVFLTMLWCNLLKTAENYRQGLERKYIEYTCDSCAHNIICTYV